MQAASHNGAERRRTVVCVGGHDHLPLTEKVEFKTVLQKGNRIQIPRKIRWRFKMEPDQLLKVSVYPINVFSASWQSFYTSMTKDGRITVPKLYLLLLASEEKTRYVLRVILEPV